MPGTNARRRNVLRAAWLAITVAGAISLTACNDDTSPEQKALDVNQVKWSDSGITSYVYHFDTACFCPAEETIVITVSDGTIVDAFYTPSGTTVSADRMAGLFVVEDLFAYIQASIDDDVHVLDVRYNATYGYPESIYVDIADLLADEEISYYISSLE